MDNLIKTHVIVTSQDNLFKLRDADGKLVLVLTNEERINRIADTLNVLSGKLSGDPNGTATREERELWRHTAIAWSDKVEKAAQALLDCFDLEEDNAVHYPDDAIAYQQVKSHHDLDVCIAQLAAMLKTGK